MATYTESEDNTMPLKIDLVIIDPQKDFCDPNGSLFVPGAAEDMKRLASLVGRLKNKLKPQFSCSMETIEN